MSYSDFNLIDATGNSVEYKFKYPTIVNIDQSGLEYRYTRQFTHCLEIQVNQLTLRNDDAGVEQACDSPYNRFEFRDFFNSVKGAEIPFRVRCWVDYKLTLDHYPDFNNNGATYSYTKLFPYTHPTLGLVYRVVKVYCHGGIRSYKTINQVESITKVNSLDSDTNLYSLLNTSEYDLYNIPGGITNPDVTFSFIKANTTKPLTSVEGTFLYLVRFQSPEVVMSQDGWGNYTTSFNLVSFEEAEIVKPARYDYPREMTAPIRSLRLKRDQDLSANILNTAVSTELGRVNQTFTLGWRSEYSESTNTSLAVYDARNKDTTITLSDLNLDGIDTHLVLNQFLANKGNLLTFRYLYAGFGSLLSTCRFDTDEISIRVNRIDLLDDCYSNFTISGLRVRAFDLNPGAVLNPPYATILRLTAKSPTPISKQTLTLAALNAQTAPSLQELGDVTLKGVVIEKPTANPAISQGLPATNFTSTTITNQMGWSGSVGNPYTNSGNSSAIVPIAAIPLNRTQTAIITFSKPSVTLTTTHLLGLLLYNWEDNTIQALPTNFYNMENPANTPIRGIVQSEAYSRVCQEHRLTKVIRGKIGLEYWIIVQDGVLIAQEVGGKLEMIMRPFTTNTSTLTNRTNLEILRYDRRRDIYTQANFVTDSALANFTWLGLNYRIESMDSANRSNDINNRRLPAYTLNLGGTQSSSAGFMSNPGTSESFGWRIRPTTSFSSNSSSISSTCDFLINGQVKMTANLNIMGNNDRTLGSGGFCPVFDGGISSTRTAVTNSFCTTSDTGGFLAYQLPTSGHTLVTVAVSAYATTGFNVAAEDVSTTNKHFGIFRLTDGTDLETQQEVRYQYTQILNGYPNTFLHCTNGTSRAIGTELTTSNAGFNFFNTHRGSICDDAHGNIFALSDSGQLILLPYNSSKPLVVDNNFTPDQVEFNLSYTSTPAPYNKHTRCPMVCNRFTGTIDAITINSNQLSAHKILTY